MITNTVSHDYTLVDQLSSVTITQPAVVHTNESNIENKICNIKTKVSHLIRNIPRSSYKGTKAAVKYTYETINAYPKIAVSTLILSTALLLTLMTCNIMYESQGISHPIIASSTFASSLVTALVSILVLVSLIVYEYKAYIDLGENHLILATFAVTVVVASAWAWVVLSAYTYKLGSI